METDHHDGPPWETSDNTTDEAPSSNGPSSEASDEDPTDDASSDDDSSDNDFSDDPTDEEEELSIYPTCGLCRFYFEPGDWVVSGVHVLYN